MSGQSQTRTLRPILTALAVIGGILGVYIALSVKAYGIASFFALALLGVLWSDVMNGQWSETP